MHNYSDKFFKKSKVPYPESSSPMSPTEGALRGPFGTEGALAGPSLSSVVLDSGDMPAQGFGEVESESFLGVPSLVGVATAALGGAATGGLAAESWIGAGIGAGFNASLWSALTLVGSWKVSDTGTKVILGGTTVAGAIATLYFYFKRHHQRKG